MCVWLGKAMQEDRSGKIDPKAFIRKMIGADPISARS